MDGIYDTVLEVFKDLGIDRKKSGQGVAVYLSTTSLDKRDDIVYLFLDSSNLVLTIKDQYLLFPNNRYLIQEVRTSGQTDVVEETWNVSDLSDLEKLVFRWLGKNL